MTWLNYFFWINFIFATKVDLPIEASEDVEMLNSLKEFIHQINQAQLEAQDAPVAQALMGYMTPFSSKPKLIKALSDKYAMNFLNYAAASYCSKNELEEWNCYNCQGYGTKTKDVVYLGHDEHKSAAFLGINPERELIVVSYRGTSNLKNWFINFKINLVPLNITGGPSIKVHSGFNQVANALLPKTRAALLMAMKDNPGYKVVFTGHSLGGALATLSAVKLAEEGALKWEDIELITFGQPRVGNTPFAHYLNSKALGSARVTTKGDLVPISPGHTIGYYHSQHIIHMNMQGNIIMCSADEEDPQCYEYYRHFSLDAHFTFWNQRINSSCKDPNTNDPPHWFWRTKDKVFDFFKGIWNKYY